MLRGQVPDKSLLKKVSQRLLRTGLGSQSKVQVTIRNGQVTMTGMLQYENQRRAVLTAARGVEGVRTIIDQLQIKANQRRW